MTAYVIESKGKRNKNWKPVLICTSKREADKEIEWFLELAISVKYRIAEYAYKRVAE